MAFLRTLENKLYKDAEGNKVDTKDWKNAPVELWNSTTFIEYVNHLNEVKFQMRPENINVKVSRVTIANDIKKYGTANLKKFVEEAMKMYKPKPQYPTITYMTLRNFYMGSVMPRILKGDSTQQQEAPNQVVKDFDVEEVIDLF